MMYYFWFSVLYLLSLLPLRVLYVISDCLYPVVYRIAGYRKDVVARNLRDSFPEYGEERLKEIEHDFYHWFCDYMVETLKMFSISESQMRRRMVFEDMDGVLADLEKGRSIALLLGHCCNWEWITWMSLHVPRGICGGQLYHPLENKTIDRLLRYTRGRAGGQCLKMGEALQTLVRQQQEGKQTITGYIADQAPGFKSMHCWTMFLNHKTPVYTGAERIARLLNHCIYYLDISRERRGQYVCKMVKITDNAQELPKFSITEQYVRLLEENIRRAPHLWLWSHNRWKRTWEDFVKAIPDERERQRILNKL